MDWPLVFVIVFFASFTQSLAGFGVALVSMPLLALVLGVRIATPLVAAVALTTELILLAYFRDHLNIRVVWQLAAASILGVPFGVLGLRKVDEEIVLSLLGLVICGYALYTLLKFHLPSVRNAFWAWGAGFMAGVLGGAYNTSGPPVIIYGHSRGWAPAEFKGNLQGFFFLNSLVVLTSHFLARNYTAQVWQSSLAALPAIAVGTWAGLSLSSRVDAALFRKIVLWFLVALGLWLVIG